MSGDVPGLLKGFFNMKGLVHPVIDQKLGQEYDVPDAEEGRHSQDSLRVTLAKMPNSGERNFEEFTSTR